MRILMALGIFWGLLIAGCQAPTPPNTNTWQLINAESRLEFISVKKGTLVEVHKFTALSGEVDPQGEARIVIALDSVETNIDIRNERMRTYLFGTDTMPDATISGQIDTAAFANLQSGERLQFSSPVRINLHGKIDTIGVDMIVTRLSADKVMVESATPIVIDVDDFDMTAGVEKLRELANLPSITPEAPVMFSLVFQR